MADWLTWIQLSNLFARDGQTLLDSLRIDLDGVCQQHDISPDLVFVTGDLSHSAEPYQFQAVLLGLTSLRRHFGISQRNIFIVPGNHDVQRVISTPSIDAGFADRRAFKADTSNLSMAGLETYAECLEDAGYQHLLGNRDTLTFFEMRSIGDVKIGVAGFNSAWSAAIGTEIGNLEIRSDSQFESIMERWPRELDLAVALVHHSPDWLVVDESWRFDSLLSWNFDCILCGHEHSGRWIEPGSSRVGSTTIFGGTLNYGDHYDRSGYHVVRANLVTREIEIRSRKYVRNQRCWKDRPLDRESDSTPTRLLGAIRNGPISRLARTAAGIKAISELSTVARELPNAAEPFVPQLKEVQFHLAKIARLQVEIDSVSITAFREPRAQALRAEVDSFRLKAKGFVGQLAEFRYAADHWLELAERQLAEIERIVKTEPNPQVFRAGAPVERSREAFIPRHALHAELQEQLLHAEGCPGLILYGRRRIGKSTILRNVRHYLPSSVRVATLSVEDPEAFTSVASFCNLLANTILARETMLPSITQSVGNTELRDLRDLSRLLTKVDGILKERNERLLIAIDEYEYLDALIGMADRDFDEDLLRAIRTSIQDHRQITWMFSGSHSVDELQHAAWSSFLVSSRTIEVLPFSIHETQLLLTDPLRESPRWANPVRRPQYQPEFWGDSADTGINRIHHEAAGWPHLVQLIAETAVSLVNRFGHSHVSSVVLEQTLNQAIVNGDMVLRQLVQRECTLPGEWEWIRRFRNVDAQRPPDNDEVFRALRRRLLVADCGDGRWKLRVPLMKRWLIERG